MISICSGLQPRRTENSHSDFLTPLCLSLGPIKNQYALFWDFYLDVWGGRGSISHQPGHVLQAVAHMREM